MEQFPKLENNNEIFNSKIYLESGFKDMNQRNALLEKISINPDSIIHDVKDIIKNIAEKSKVIFFGIDHASCISHNKIAEYLSSLPNNNVNLFVEYPPAIQENINQFIKTGKFSNLDDPTLYDKIYDYVEKGGLELELPDNLKGTFFDSRPSVIQIFSILKKAKELGLNILAGDQYSDSSLEDNDDMLKRDNGMFQNLKESVKKFDTTIVVAGGNHVLNGEYELSIGSYPYVNKEKVTSVARLSKEYFGDSEVKTFWLENQLHNKKYADDNQVVSSALFDKMKTLKSGEEEIGLKIEEGCIEGVKDITQGIKVDYYIPVFE